MSKIIPKKVNKRDRLDLIISTLTAPLLFIIIFSSIVLIAVAQIDGVEEYTTDTEYAPDAEFSADVIWGYAPLTVKFTDESTGNPTEWKWNFGDGSPIIDGTTSDYQNPTYTYEKAGVYEVKETAINSAGRNTEIKAGYITVKPSDDSDLQPSKHTPNAEFFADITSGYAPLAVKFTDKSSGNPTEWKWNFGDGSPIIDGTTSDYQNPTHTYEKAGVYEVKETAINSVGRNTEIKTEYITVKSSKDIENTDYSGSQISDEKYFTRDSQDESDTETDVPPQTQIIETITQFYTTHVEDISTTFIDDKDTNTIYNNPSSDPSNGDSIVNNIITVIGSIISAVIVAYIQTKRK
ncbi:PKD domain-containing protein [Methanosarcina mazei]|uniref:Cell surface protein n=1 Tax=Methanosarcina mazei SarPi TaxID=1434115 RepID=A0A0E3RBZ6_METMZ|nr:PKD domain-containing protein [Methanosarcina mazei]AKB61418.1 cell surface protein [Methanosarcina mazei SarPi]